MPTLSSGDTARCASEPFAGWSLVPAVLHLGTDARENARTCRCARTESDAKSNTTSEPAFAPDAGKKSTLCFLKAHITGYQAKTCLFTRGVVWTDSCTKVPTNLIRRLRISSPEPNATRREVVSCSHARLLERFTDRMNHRSPPTCRDRQRLEEAKSVLFPAHARVHLCLSRDALCAPDRVLSRRARDRPARGTGRLSRVFGARAATPTGTRRPSRVGQAMLARWGKVGTVGSGEKEAKAGGGQSCQGRACTRDADWGRSQHVRRRSGTARRGAVEMRVVLATTLEMS